jgi:hypothetical protein
MALENEELTVIFDEACSGCVGSTAIFQCLFNALKLQPGIDAETLASDLKDQLERYAGLLPQPAWAKGCIPRFEPALSRRSGVTVRPS